MASLNSYFHLLVLLFLVLLTKSFNSDAENSTTGCIDKEREALLLFKQGLKDPSGWLSSWDVGVDCCNWLGVGCDNQTGYVSRLDLRSQSEYDCSDFEESEAADHNVSCLSGTLNPSLLNLTHLNYLDLSNNNFQGIPFPEFIVSLRNLRYLDLSFVSFTGMVPSDLGNLSNLQYLGLGMMDSYPRLWVSNLNWLSSLSSLRYLYLSGLDLRNASTNWLQVLNMLPSLRELHLSSSELSTFPQSVPFVNFTSLSVLDLSGNEFQGIPIPNFIGSLKNLRHLDLSGASFIGMVSPSLGNQSNLQYLDLSWLSIWNSDINWLSGLSSLQYLNLESVNLSKATTSWLQVANMLPMLRELYLSGCGLRNFQYSLPFINFTSLSVLDLYDNNFNSPIPQWLFNVSTLTTIQLSRCELSGSIPRVMQESLCNLRDLDLSDNAISGEITEFIEALSRCNNRTLQTLRFHSNKLSGNLPVSLGHFKYLERLALALNSFTGALPTSIGNLSHLEILSLGFNMMDGISENVGQLTKLILLDLFGNSWEGVVTENHLQNLTELHSLWLSSTRKSLVFNVRQDWIAPFSLGYIQISDCQLGLAFPSWLRTQIDVQRLVLSNVAISDEIPDWFWRLLSRHLFWLDLSNNQLRGKLPRSINVQDAQYIDLSSNLLEGSIPLWKNVTSLSLSNNSLSGEIPINIGHEMSGLENLDLSRNLVNGSIPASMGEMRYLQFLDLSNNYLSGEIPSNWHNLEQLSDIDLSSNNFSGGIPSSICSLPSLVWLKLSSNNLLEELSVSLHDCKGPSFLDLGENNFFGTIQPIVENLFNLSYLGLRANRLTGNIPDQLCRFPNLHILDLSRNDFSGYVPKCLGNLEALKFTGTYNESHHPWYYQQDFSNHLEVVLKGRNIEYTKTIPLLEVIDLSSNNLVGEIPEEITNLSALNSLNLSWNQLTGKIPESIQSLRQLETLDLSGNHLSGSIPPSMSSMTFLDHLNLSYNNLSGPIPTTNQFYTFNDPSIYEGNQFLCGPPLTTNCSSGPGDTKDKNEEVEEDEDRSEKFWLYIGMAVGFIVGFWAVCGTLVIKRSWRHAYFGLVEETKDKLHVFIAVHMAHLRRKVAGQMLEDTNVHLRLRESNLYGG